MPISLAMMMDTSGSMYYMLNAEKDAGSRFVREVMHNKDEAIVMTFDTDVNLLADFTEDPAVLARAIHRRADQRGRDGHRRNGRDYSAARRRRDESLRRDLPGGARRAGSGSRAQSYRAS